MKSLLRRLQWNTVAALQSRLDEFSRFYNEVRPHQSLGGLTPLEAWNGMSLRDVQRLNERSQGHWVQALDGLLVGYRWRC